MLDLETLRPLAARIVETATAAGLMIATAESCTGGLIAGCLTAIPGSSAVVDRGFVTYSNEAKAEMIGVEPDLIDRFGAVSAEVARAMAVGVIAHSRAHVAVSVTGIAGPGGGSAEKPVGLVHFALAGRSGRVIHVERRFGDIGRDEIRLASVAQALDLVARAIVAETSSG